MGITIEREGGGVGLEIDLEASLEKRQPAKFRNYYCNLVTLYIEVF